jgi:hypothetical protein
MLRVGGDSLEKTMEDKMESLGRSCWPEHGFESLEEIPPRVNLKESAAGLQ